MSPRERDTSNRSPSTDLPAAAAEGELPTVGPVTPETTSDAGMAETPTDAPSAPSLREIILRDVEQYFADEANTSDDSIAAPPSSEFIQSRFFEFDFVGSDTVVDYYWVNKPYAFVVVLYDELDHEHRYHVVEPVLDEFETYVREDLTKVLRNSLLYTDLEHGDDRRSVFQSEAKATLEKQATSVEAGSAHKLLYYLVRDFVHFGRIDGIMRDPNVEDVSCDGDEIPVFVYHGDYRDLATNVQFGHSELTSFTIRLAQQAGKQISVSDPLVDASLPDGSRIQLTLGTDISTRGSNFTIRKFSEVPYTPVDLIRWNTFTADQMAYFWLAIENNRSLLFAGGTGSGKTTSMNAVSFFIPQNSKVVSIEDTREITLPHDNWIQSVTRDSFTADGRGEVSMYQLLQASLRQRPEYLLVGEIRTEPKVALTFFHAIATGHTAYSTVHADSAEGVLNRLQNEPLGVPAKMLEGLDIISIQRQITLDDTRVRRNLHVAELERDAADALSATDVFARDPKTDTHEEVGQSRVLAEIAEERGWTTAQLESELRTRRDVLQYMVDNDIDDYHAVAAFIHAFSKSPEYIINLLGDRSVDVSDLPAAVEAAAREESSNETHEADAEETDE